MSQAEPPVLVLTTIGSVHDAGKIAADLVGRRLAACVNIVDQVRSFYRWEGAVTEDAEKLLVIKTLAGRVEALREHLSTIHPYALPEFVVIPAAGASEAYARWIADSVLGDGSGAG